MDPLLIDRNKLLRLMKRAGFGSQHAFAEAIGLSGPKLSNILKGARRAQTAEIQRMAAALKTPASKILQALGIQDSEPFVGIYKIGGFVNDSEEVLLVDENADDYGLHEVRIPFLAYGGEILSIRTETLSPRYLCGELIGVSVWEVNTNLDRVPVGVDVVAQIRGGPMVLKALYRGSSSGRFTLLSPTARLAPITDADLEWAEPVAFKLPKIFSE